MRRCVHVFPGMGTSNSNKQKPCLVTNIIHQLRHNAVHWEASGHRECVVSQIISHFSSLPLNITTWNMLHHPHHNIHHSRSHHHNAALWRSGSVTNYNQSFTPGLPACSSPIGPIARLRTQTDRGWYWPIDSFRFFWTNIHPCWQSLAVCDTCTANSGSRSATCISDDIVNLTSNLTMVGIPESIKTLISSQKFFLGLYISSNQSKHFCMEGWWQHWWRLSGWFVGVRSEGEAVVLQGSGY